ncbi:MAG: TIGR02300 family protein, partial [Xanthobacteraceae bacterium]
TGQVKPPNCTKDRTVTKPELGTKRLCASCGAKFYDLNKDPIHCTKCGAVYEVVVATRPVRQQAAPVAPRRPVAKEAPAPEPQEIETVSLEEAEAQGTVKKPAPAEVGIEDEEEVEMDESVDNDDTLIEEQEEEDADVTDIIGGDIENKEEG